MSSNVRVAKVPVDKVTFHPHNVRRDLGDLRPLAASIRRFGVMQPIIVEQYGDALRLRAGHRRLAAARLAGLTRIPALIHDEALEDAEWLVHSVQENVMRRGLDVDERARAINALRDLGCSWEGIGEAFAVTAITARVWAHGSQDRAQEKPKAVGNTTRTIVSARAIRQVAAAWRDADGRATVADLLDALERLADTGKAQDAMPDQLARRRRRRTS